MTPMDACINNQKPFKSLLIALCLAMGNVSDAVEIMAVGFIMTEISSLSTLDKSWLSAASFMGMLFGGAIGGYLSDIVGRRQALLYSLGINALAGLVSAGSISLLMLVFLRIIGGLGIGGTVPILFSLGAEIFPQETRGRYLLVIASAWMVGATYAALAAWLMLGDDLYGNRIMVGVTWRAYALVCAIPAIIAFLLSYHIIPESPRFLADKGRYEEACIVLRNLSNVPVTSSELQLDRIEFTSLPTAEPMTVAVDDRGGSRGSDHHSAAKTSSTLKSKFLSENWKVLFGKDYARVSIVLAVTWFTLSFGSYGISNWISTLFSDVGIGNPYAASFIFAVANLPGNIVSYYLIDWIGRRWLLSIGMCLAGVSCLGFALDTSDQVVVVLSASLFNAFSVMGWNSLDCLAAEAFPTSARSTAMGFLAASGRLGAICGQFVDASLEANIPLLLFVTCGCSFVGGVTAWALPHDTAGISLDTQKKGTDSEVDDPWKGKSGLDNSSIMVHNPLVESAF